MQVGEGSKVVVEDGQHKLRSRRAGIRPNLIDIKTSFIWPDPGEAPAEPLAGARLPPSRWQARGSRRAVGRREAPGQPAIVQLPCLSGRKLALLFVFVEEIHVGRAAIWATIT